MDYSIFQNKNCFITGATGGLGSLVAMKLAEHGCNLFLTSTSDSKLKALKEHIRSSHGQDAEVFYEKGDLNKTDDISKLIRSGREKLSSFDIFIYCSGAFIVKSITDCDLEDYEKTFNLNVRAAFLFCKAFSRDMIAKKWGRIVTVGSSSAYAGFRDTSLYCASKHALLGFSRALHDELKPFNIRTYCISPAGMKTEMGRLIKGQNFETFIDPKDVADYIIHICSFDAEMISEEIRLNRMVVE